MNNLEISDVYDVYYDGRQRFPELPDLPGRNTSTRDGRAGRSPARYRARSATTASSTIMPDGVARNRELPTGATSPSS
jgi:hypothetical protein